MTDRGINVAAARRLLFTKREDKTRGTSSVKVHCVRLRDTFLENVERALCVRLEDGAGGCHPARKEVLKDMQKKAGHRT